jgi:hypothetical protein
VSSSGKRRWRYRDLGPRAKRVYVYKLLFIVWTFMVITLVAGWRVGVLESQDQPSDDIKRLVFSGMAAGEILGMITGLIWVMVLIRPSRTVLQIVEDRAEWADVHVNEKLKVLRAQDAVAMERWKSDTVAELYAMIMDQVERGVITCHACADRQEPEPRSDRVLEVPKPCDCQGPASVRVAYNLPRFQSKKMAS